MTQEPLEFVAGEIRRDIEMKIKALDKLGSLRRTELVVIGQLRARAAWSMDQAISIGDIIDAEDAAGPNSMSPRSVKQAVKELIETHGIPIGSSRLQPHPGYFFIISDESAEAAVRPLQAEIYSLFRRVKALAPRSAFVRKLNGQVEMLLESDL